MLNDREDKKGNRNRERNLEVNGKKVASNEDKKRKAKQQKKSPKNCVCAVYLSG